MQHLGEIELDLDHVDAPGVLAAGVEEIVDQLEQVAGRGPGAGEVIGAGRRLVIAERQIDHADHAGQRRAQLVGDAGEEAGLGPGLVAGPLAVEDQLAAAVGVVGDVLHGAAEERRLAGVVERSQCINMRSWAQPSPRWTRSSISSTLAAGHDPIGGGAQRGHVVGMDQRGVGLEAGGRRGSGRQAVQLVHHRRPRRGAGLEVVLEGADAGTALRLLEAALGPCQLVRTLQAAAPGTRRRARAANTTRAPARPSSTSDTRPLIHGVRPRLEAAQVARLQDERRRPSPP